ncbi:protein phosphatase [Novymonas esmeraldas]|uniref:Protein phosphatase n=1 Tax=Novymonas esmeraldas TaxID=1808958 RepID=A0AAW0EQ35_9TRYP
MHRASSAAAMAPTGPPVAETSAPPTQSPQLPLTRDAPHTIAVPRNGSGVMVHHHPISGEVRVVAGETALLSGWACAARLSAYPHSDTVQLTLLLPRLRVYVDGQRLLRLGSPVELQPCQRVCFGADSASFLAVLCSLPPPATATAPAAADRGERDGGDVPHERQSPPPPSRQSRGRGSDGEACEDQRHTRSVKSRRPAVLDRGTTPRGTVLPVEGPTPVSRINMLSRRSADSRTDATATTAEMQPLGGRGGGLSANSDDLLVECSAAVATQSTADVLESDVIAAKADTVVDGGVAAHARRCAVTLLDVGPVPRVRSPDWAALQAAQLDGTPPRPAGFYRCSGGSVAFGDALLHRRRHHAQVATPQSPRAAKAGWPPPMSRAAAPPRCTAASSAPSCESSGRYSLQFSDRTSLDAVDLDMSVGTCTAPQSAGETAEVTPTEAISGSDGDAAAAAAAAQALKGCAPYMRERLRLLPRVAVEPFLVETFGNTHRYRPLAHAGDAERAGSTLSRSRSSSSSSSRSSASDAAAAGVQDGSACIPWQHPEAADEVVSPRTEALLRGVLRRRPDAASAAEDAVFLHCALRRTYDAVADRFSYVGAPALAQRMHQRFTSLITALHARLAEGRPVLRLASPLLCAGDLCGSFADLLLLLDNAAYFGHWSALHTPLLLLGNYVDVGWHSVEVVMLLCCWAYLQPDSVHLLRGPHEDPAVNGDYRRLGKRCLRYKCRQRFGADRGVALWTQLNNLFTVLPIAAVVDDHVFAVHGGVPLLRQSRPQTGGGAEPGSATARRHRRHRSPGAAAFATPWLHLYSTTSGSPTPTCSDAVVPPSALVHPPSASASSRGPPAGAAMEGSVDMGEDGGHVAATASVAPASHTSSAASRSRVGSHHRSSTPRRPGACDGATAVRWSGSVSSSFLLACAANSGVEQEHGEHEHTRTCESRSTPVSASAESTAAESAAPPSQAPPLQQQQQWTEMTEEEADAPTEEDFAALLAATRVEAYAFGSLQPPLAGDTVEADRDVARRRRRLVRELLWNRPRTAVAKMLMPERTELPTGDECGAAAPVTPWWRPHHVEVCCVDGECSSGAAGVHRCCRIFGSGALIRFLSRSGFSLLMRGGPEDPAELCGAELTDEGRQLALSTYTRRHKAALQAAACVVSRATLRLITWGAQELADSLGQVSLSCLPGVREAEQARVSFAEFVCGALDVRLREHDVVGSGDQWSVRSAFHHYGRHHHAAAGEPLP